MNRLLFFKHIALLIPLTAWSLHAQAADTRPLSSLDTQGFARGISAKTLNHLEAATAISYERAGDIVEGREVLDPNDSQDQAYHSKALKDFQKAHVTAALGLWEWLELNLSSAVTYEDMEAPTRDKAFNLESQEEKDAWRDQFKQTGYAGSTLMAKFSVFSSSGFDISLASFVEEGTGHRNRYSLSRSSSSKLGSILAATYEKEQLGKINVYAGYRDRDEEQVGRLRFAQEYFLGTDIEWQVHSLASLQIGSFTRQLRVAKLEEDKPWGSPYRFDQSVELFAGASTYVSNVKLTLYGGTNLPGSSGIDRSQQNFGIKIAVATDAVKSSAPGEQDEKKVSKPESDKEDEKASPTQQDREDKTDQAPEEEPAEDSKKQPKGKEKEDLNGHGDFRDEIFADDKTVKDSLKSGPKDDFDRTIEGIKQQEKEELARKKRAEKREKSIEDLQRELKDLKIAEEQAEIEREKRRKVMQAAAQKRALAREKREQGRLNKLRKKAEKDARLDEVTIDDTSWYGLDENDF